MDENQKKLIGAVGNIFNSASITIQAISKFREGKYEEGAGKIAAAAGTVMTNWAAISESWEYIQSKAGLINSQTALNIARTNPPVPGSLTGAWFSNDRRINEYIYHDKAKNIVQFFANKSSGTGYNVYTGGYNPNTGMIAWTGYNSRNYFLSMVGIIDYQEQKIFILTWVRNPQTNQLELLNDKDTLIRN